MLASRAFEFMFEPTIKTFRMKDMFTIELLNLSISLQHILTYETYNLGLLLLKLVGPNAIDNLLSLKICNVLLLLALVMGVWLIFIYIVRVIVFVLRVILLELSVQVSKETGELIEGVSNLLSNLGRKVLKARHVVMARLF